jgi:hypothetical protein
MYFLKSFRTSFNHFLPCETSVRVNLSIGILKWRLLISPGEAAVCGPVELVEGEAEANVWYSAGRCRRARGEDQRVDGSLLDCDNDALHSRYRPGERGAITVLSEYRPQRRHKLSQTRTAGSSMRDLPFIFAIMVSRAGLEPATR